MRQLSWVSVSYIMADSTALLRDVSENRTCTAFYSGLIQGKKSSIKTALNMHAKNVPLFTG